MVEDLADAIVLAAQKMHVDLADEIVLAAQEKIHHLEEREVEVDATLYLGYNIHGQRSHFVFRGVNANPSRVFYYIEDALAFAKVEGFKRLTGEVAEKAMSALVKINNMTTFRDNSAPLMVFQKIE